LKDFEAELLAFPRGKHDDQVDAFGYITYMLAPIIDSQHNYNLLIGGKKRNFMEY
jgi:phage terminase large subunit-like protein